MFSSVIYPISLILLNPPVNHENGIWLSVLWSVCMYTQLIVHMYGGANQRMVSNYGNQEIEKSLIMENKTNHNRRWKAEPHMTERIV